VEGATWSFTSFLLERNNLSKIERKIEGYALETFSLAWGTSRHHAVLDLVLFAVE